MEGLDSGAVAHYIAWSLLSLAAGTAVGIIYCGFPRHGGRAKAIVFSGALLAAVALEEWLIAAAAATVAYWSVVIWHQEICLDWYERRARRLEERIGQ